MNSQNAYQQQGSTSTSRVGIEKRRAAPYGQACLHCFKTKSKCVKSNSSLDSCERCIRLKKQCSPADSLRKRSSQKPSNTNATIANLQAEIEELKRRVPPAGESATLATLPSFAKRPAEDYEDYKAKLEEHDDQMDSVASSTTSTEWDLSPDQEQKRLIIFQTRMLRFFAFMHLWDGLTVEQLQADKPFLFLAIMAVTSPSVREKRARADKLKRYLAQETLEKTETSLDLLLCLLTYIAFGYDNFVYKLKSPSRLTQLAISMAYDLRLHKAMPKESSLFPNETMRPNQQAFEISQQSLESKRAVLGCFLLSSQVSSHYGCMEPMRWTPQMQDYLSIIGRNANCPTDEMFAWQIRLQLLIQQANEQRDQRELDHYQEAASATSSKEPIIHKWYFESLQGKLKEMIASIPPHIKNSETLRLQLHFTSLSICESIYPVNQDNKPSYSVNNITTALDQRDIQYHSLQAIKAFYETFSTLSALDFTAFPILVWCQSLKNMMVLYRLSLNPTYRDEVRNTVDVLRESHRTAEKLEGAAIEMRESAPDDLFTILCQVARAFHKYAARKLGPSPHLQQPMGTENQGVDFIPPSSWAFSGSDSGVEFMSPPDLITRAMLEMYGLDPSPPAMPLEMPGGLDPSTGYYHPYV
ncbi:hypothetical protein BJX70DRAFT_141885 [Aspergillus crustosus]